MEEREAQFFGDGFDGDGAGVFEASVDGFVVFAEDTDGVDLGGVALLQGVQRAEGVDGEFVCAAE